MIKVGDNGWMGWMQEGKKKQTSVEGSGHLNFQIETLHLDS